MKVGIIGAGDIGQIYGRLWRDAGHEVMISARDADKVAKIADRIGVEAGTPADAVTDADAVLLAVNYAGLDDALARMSSGINGKLLIDATNPLAARDGGVERMIDEAQLAAEVLAVKLPQVRIAKTFTSLWSKYVEEHSDRADPKIAMPFVVQYASDKDIVAGLIADAGFVPVPLGGLIDSRPLDPGSPVWNVVLTLDELHATIADTYGPK